MVGNEVTLCLLGWVLGYEEVVGGRSWDCGGRVGGKRRVSMWCLADAGTSDSTPLQDADMVLNMHNIPTDALNVL